jgi:hypothetical protein
MKRYLRPKVRAARKMRENRARLVLGCFRRLKLGHIMKHADEIYERAVVRRAMKVMACKYREGQEDKSHIMQALRFRRNTLVEWYFQ